MRTAQANAEKADKLVFQQQKMFEIPFVSFIIGNHVFEFILRLGSSSGIVLSL